MGRKSLANERTEEILDAFERCILQFGLEGTSLEQIAEEAGVKRSIIRHYIGNREQVVTALIERLMGKYEQGLTELLTEVGKSRWVPLLLDALFDEPDDEEARRDRILGEVLVNGPERYPQTTARFLAVYERMIAQVAEALSQAYPHAATDECQAVAYALFSLSNADSDMQWLGVNPRYTKMARTVAESLIQQLAQRNAVGARH